jgi:hypothetical protein
VVSCSVGTVSGRAHPHPRRPAGPQSRRAFCQRPLPTPPTRWGGPDHAARSAAPRSRAPAAPHCPRTARTGSEDQLSTRRSLDGAHHNPPPPKQGAEGAARRAASGHERYSAEHPPHRRVTRAAVAREAAAARAARVPGPAAAAGAVAAALFVGACLYWIAVLLWPPPGPVGAPSL